MPNRKQGGTSSHTVTPEERGLLEGPASELYEYVVTRGGITEDEPRIADGAPERPAFDLLVRLGLLNHDSEHDMYLPMDPSIVSSQVVTPMGQQGAELLTESSRWAQSFNTLGLMWRRSPGTKQGPITEIRGNENINRLIKTVVDDSRTELLTAQPQTVRSTDRIKVWAERDIRALERGVTMRTLYQHSARRSSATYAYVSAVTEKGAEVRTLDEFFNRMIVVDREVAFIPGHEGPEVALVVRDAGILAYLVDVFERAWERARPFANREPGTLQGIAIEQREMTIRMLVEGHPDPVAAKRLGVSPRTYAGYVADLKHEYEAETRFQLGYAMGQRQSSTKESE